MVEMVKKYYHNPHEDQELTVGILESKLANLATKQDLALYATRQDLTMYATKLELDAAVAKLATRHDLSTVKNELQLEIRSLEIRMGKGFTDNLRWMVMAMIAMSSIVIACVKLI